jgi:hypothetical protein
MGEQTGEGGTAGLAMLDVFVTAQCTYMGDAAQLPPSSQGPTAAASSPLQFQAISKDGQSSKALVARIQIQSPSCGSIEPLLAIKEGRHGGVAGGGMLGGKSVRLAGEGGGGGACCEADGCMLGLQQ